MKNPCPPPNFSLLSSYLLVYPLHLPPVPLMVLGCDFVSLPDFLFNLTLKLLYLTIHTPSLCGLVTHQGSGPSIHLRFWQLSSVSRSALVLSGCSIQHLHPPDLIFCKHLSHFHHPPLWIPGTWSKMKSTWKFEQIQTSQPLMLISNLFLSPFNINLYKNKAHYSYFRLKWIQCKDENSCKSVGRIGRGSSRLIITQIITRLLDYLFITR